MINFPNQSFLTPKKQVGRTTKSMNGLWEWKMKLGKERKILFWEERNFQAFFSAKMARDHYGLQWLWRPSLQGLISFYLFKSLHSLIYLYLFKSLSCNPFLINQSNYSSLLALFTVVIWASCVCLHILLFFFFEYIKCDQYIYNFSIYILLCSGELTRICVIILDMSQFKESCKTCSFFDFIVCPIC